MNDKKLTTAPGTAGRAILPLLLWPFIAAADHPGDENHHTPDTPAEIAAQVVEYPAAFFARYQPNTALDMVNQVPGFQLNDGESTRGFAGAAGNILINDRRPNVKQDTPTAILGRIPASNVVRIDLVRGQMSGVDLQGQSVVANIILLDESEAAVRWEAYLWKNTENGVLMPGGSISLSDRRGGVEYNTGIDGNRHAHGSIGSRNSYDAAGALTEDRAEDILNKHFLINGNFNASTWYGETLWHLNSKLGYSDVIEVLEADRIPQAAGSTPRREVIEDNRESHYYELGLTAERRLGTDLTSKSILIMIQNQHNALSTQQDLDHSGQETLFRVADTGTDTTEAIARMELDWSAIPDHSIQLNLEGAYNALDGSLLQTVDTGAGPVIDDVPGANTRVEEVRGDFRLSDTWMLGRFQLNYGLGAEVSRLTQTGDAELERDFFFLKPQVLVVYSPEQRRQTRLKIAREVSQLDFNDFVSAAVFQDNDLALGNPNLRPERTWVADLTHERRFGEISVLKLRAYHHWITDVEDLLPLTDTFEAPGNIGDGRRWGFEIENTLPLDWLGLRAARLDIKARWQDSSVTDPVTGEDRVLSSEGRISAQIPYNDLDLRYITAVDFRQDFQPQQMAWGWEARARAERPLYKVNELDVYDEGTEFNVFVETTRWFGLKMRLSGNDLFNTAKTRIRTIYTGEWGSSAVARREVTDLTRGRQFEVTLIGSF